MPGLQLPLAIYLDTIKDRNGEGLTEAEEMRHKEPGKCASWNVGVMCPEMPVYWEAFQHGIQREGECGLGPYD